VFFSFLGIFIPAKGKFSAGSQTLLSSELRALKINPQRQVMIR
jgi:hypothetical protein